MLVLLLLLMVVLLLPCAAGADALPMLLSAGFQLEGFTPTFAALSALAGASRAPTWCSCSSSACCA
jgi:hypothetical protein